MHQVGLSGFLTVPLFRLLIVALGINLLLACRKETPMPIPPNPEPKYRQYGIPFQGMPATQDIVMYEVNMRAYSPAGNLQGVIDRLDSIKLLGVNVLWIMPLHPVGILKGINSPYCIRDYKAVGAEYGTLNDLRRLTDAAHAKGMAVIMDWVANHSSWDHPWMQNEGWHTRNAQGQVVHPPGTNWLDVADLNYQNMEMRAAMQDAMLYWLYEANVDGYRCDYADGVPYDFWQDTWSLVHSIPGRQFILFAEGTKPDHFNAGFDLNFAWSSYSILQQVWQGQSPQNFLNNRLIQTNSSPQGKYWLQFTTNHDESAWDATPVTLFGGLTGALAASALTLMSGGPHLLYGSQEVGTALNIPFFSRSAINWQANPGMLRAYRSMMTFYGSHAAARSGSLTSYPHPDLAVIHKTLGSDTVLALVNTRNRVLSYSVPLSLQGSQWRSEFASAMVNAPTTPTLIFPNELTLQPFEVLLLTKP